MMFDGAHLRRAVEAATLDAVRAPGAFEAVVIGAGATGTFASLMLTEAGARVLLLDAGLPPDRLRGFTRRITTGIARRLLGRAAVERRARRRQPIQSQCYAWRGAPDAFVDDIRCPYVTPSDPSFVWLRARQLGGRWAIPEHGRQYYRLGPEDLASHENSGEAWPLAPGELDAWYGLVERRLAVAGRRDDLPWLPDSEIATVVTPTQTERALQEAIEARWPGERAVLSRYAAPLNTLEVAAATGKLLVRQGAVARKIDVDAAGRVRGVVWADARSRTEQRVEAPLVFLCASALESTRLLLLSGNAQSPEGLGSSSGVLGRYLMDHLRLKIEGTGPPLPVDDIARGRCLYLPRFDAREEATPPPARGFGVQVYRQGIPDADHSGFSAASFGEMVPDRDNRVTLHPTLRDAWGIPVLNIECRHSAQDLELAREQSRALRELAEVAGVTITRIDEAPAPPGSANHECGTARMGSDPANSVLNPHNECWEAEGLYVPDGASFPSQGSQNPTLTLLALTARACAHALASSAPAAHPTPPQPDAHGEAPRRGTDRTPAPS